MPTNDAVAGRAWLGTLRIKREGDPSGLKTAWQNTKLLRQCEPTEFDAIAFIKAGDKSEE